MQPRPGAIAGAYSAPGPRDGDDFKVSTELAAFYFDHFEAPTAAEGPLTVMH